MDGILHVFLQKNKKRPMEGRSEARRAPRAPGPGSRRSPPARRRPGALVGPRSPQQLGALFWTPFFGLGGEPPTKKGKKNKKNRRKWVPTDSKLSNLEDLALSSTGLYLPFAALFFFEDLFGFEGTLALLNILVPGGLSKWKLYFLGLDHVLVNNKSSQCLANPLRK